jgi:hypothetical protein
LTSQGVLACLLGEDGVHRFTHANG